MNESYNTDKAGDILTKEYDSVNNKIDNKSYIQDIPSENSSISNINKVRILIIKLIIFLQELTSRTNNNANNEKIKEPQIREDSFIRKIDNSSIMTNIESNYLKRKKLFRATGLLNKSQLKLASYIKNNKNVTLQGTKRFMDKSGEYYLKNVQMQNRKQDFNYHKRGSLNNPQNLENCLNDNLSKIKKRASKIVTLLPENSLTPIPKKEGINKTGFANGIKKKELNDAQRTAVFIRRLEYSTSVKRKMVKGNKDKIAKKYQRFYFQEKFNEQFRTPGKIVSIYY